MKQPFLDQPAAWTRAPRTGQSTVDQACALEQHRDRNYSTGWWVVMLVLCVAALLAIVAQVPA